MVVLYLLSDYELVILSLEEVVILIVEQAVHSTVASPNLSHGRRLEIKLITIDTTLIFHLGKWE